MVLLPLLYCGWVEETGPVTDVVLLLHSRKGSAKMSFLLHELGDFGKVSSLGGMRIPSSLFCRWIGEL